MVMTPFAGPGLTGKAGRRPRMHVLAHEWGIMPLATDFWLFPHANIITASKPQILTDLGWSSNGTLSVTAPDHAGNLFSSGTPGVPGYVLFDSAGEVLTSPLMFGGYTRTRFIRDQLGWTPTRLIAEFYGIFTTASNSEATSGIGFTIAAVTTATNGVGVIASDGTNFRAKTTATDFTAALTGALIDTSMHYWKIVLDSGQAKVFFYMDGAAIGTSMTLPTGKYPVAFSAGAGTSNVVGLGPTHIYYD